MKFNHLLIGLAILASQATFAKSIRVMSYNVENLFDTTHDEGKDDWTFMPINSPGKESGCEEVSVEYYRKSCLETDWTPNKLELKLEQITKVVKSLGELPPVLALVEVENAAIVDRLRQKLGYQRFLITNSPDLRGVDVALLFNEGPDLKYVSSVEHKFKLSKGGVQSPTRNVLELNFLVSKKPISILVNHWPSQQSGSHSRISAAKQVLKFLEKKLAKEDSRVMLVGDFNVTEIESPNPMDDYLTKDTGLVDVYSKMTDQEKSALAPGTYFYGWDFSWNRLDRVIVSKGFLKDTPSVIPSSYTIYAPSFMSRTYVQKQPDRPHTGESAVVPWGYWHNAYSQDKAGFSDHYPILVDIDI